MITELEKTKKALEYISKLAEGIDPITDKPVAESGVGHQRVFLPSAVHQADDVIPDAEFNGYNG